MFAFSNSEGKFLIYTLSPRRAVPCCGHTLLSVGQFGTAFAVEEDEDNGIDPEVLFSPESSDSLLYTEVRMYMFTSIYTMYIDN